MPTSLCLLTFNEIQGCRIDVPQIDRRDFDEVYAVDGGSTDGTIEYLQKQGFLVYRQKRRGLNAACWEAVEQCQTEFLIFYHPKGTTPYADTLALRDALELDGYDLAVASRNIKGARNEEDSCLIKPRKWFVTLIAIVAAFFWRREGNIIWDVLHGFRGVRKSSFVLMNPPLDGFTIDISMVVRAYRKKLRRVEIPTTESPRRFGETHFKALPTGYRILVYLAKELFDRE